QEFGGHPPSIKWRQINTDTVRVILPVGVDQQAQRVANTIHYLSKNSRRSVGEKQRKLNVVLQNQTVVSNGYVSLAPFISEFYLNQPQSSHEVGSNWLDLLTIHEYRHALQFVNSRKGITNLAYILSGELGWSYFSSLSIPNWFWEGDAVVSETALTAQGRGRMPAFYNGYKSLFLDDIYYDYQKARNGSIKNFVPNHYELGYLVCNYGREIHGNDIWKDVLSDAGKYKGLFYPFSKSLKKKAEYPTYDFYVLSLRHYYEKWDSLLFRYAPKTEQLNNVDKEEAFTVYKYPYFDNEDNTIVYKVSYKEIGAFYRINPYGTEFIIKRQGRVLNSYFSYKNEKLVWAEIGQDERWGWQVNSNIIYYDIENSKKRKLTSSSKYFSPDLSYDGEKVVAFHASEDQQYSLHILDVETGSLIKEIPNPTNYYYSYPKWFENDEFIIAVARDGKGRNALIKIVLDSGQTQNFTPFTNHQIGIPWQKDNFIYYSASYSGIDNIYCVNLENGKIYSITDVKTGAYTPAVKGNELYYSEFSSLGNDIKILAYDTSTLKEIKYVEPLEMTQYDSISTLAEGGDITDSIPNRKYDTKKYSTSSHLINLHSWSLFFADPNYEWALRSNNILNTLAMKLGVRYNRNDNNFNYFFNFSYAQLYPVFSFSANYSKREGVKTTKDSGGNVISRDTVSWREYDIKPGIVVPLDLSSGLYSRKINFGGNYSYTVVDFEENEDVITTDFNLNSYQAGFSFINIRKKAKQNIFSKYSQYFNVSYNNSIDENIAKQLFADSELTFPGLFKNHNIAFQLSYQDEDAENDYRYTDNFLYARGYNRPVYDYIYKIGS
ncbi:MAG: hypothetical protein KAI29_09695, partial [Cyclobacteriaceae bacterium]|nr:hypothetical protein [Cyclobacteriaceae bacterium]